MANRPASFLKAYKKSAGRALYFAVFLSFMSAIVLVGQCWLLAHIIHAVVFEQKTFADMAVALFTFPCFFVVKVFLSQMSEVLAFNGALHIKKQVRKDLQNHLKKAGPLYVVKEGSAALLTSLVEGVEAIEGYYTRFVPAVMLCVAVPLAIVLLVFPLDWISGLVMLFTAPLIPVFMILIGRGTEALNQRQWRKLARMGNHFLDLIQGLTTLKLFNASRRKADSVTRIAEQYKRDTMEVLRVAFLSSLVLEFFATVSIAVIAVLIGFRLLYGEMGFFHGFFILLLAPEFYLPLRKMGGAYHAKMEAVGAAEKMADIMASPVSIKKHEITTDINRAKINISFDDVHFSYHEGEKVLKGLSFDIREGECVALVGPSGAGKSTIMALLLGFIEPDQGEIRINGVSLSELNIKSWRQHLSWIPQKPTLFYGSVLDNLKLGHKQASMREIERLCDKLCAADFIEKLPQKYNTIIGEQGYGLSGGQVQRLALVRAFLREAPLVLMDEPSASLDKVTENVLQKVLPALTKEKTVLTIAHRLHTIRHADKILFIENGEVIEQGIHDDLLKSHGAYAALVQQAGGRE